MVMFLIGLIFVDASQRGNMGSTCSHSCDANCTSAVVARDGELVIVLTTVRGTVYYCYDRIFFETDRKFYTDMIAVVLHCRTDTYILEKSFAWTIFLSHPLKWNGVPPSACVGPCVVEGRFYTLLHRYEIY